MKEDFFSLFIFKHASVDGVRFDRPRKALAYYKDHYLDLLTGQKVPYPIREFNKGLDGIFFKRGRGDSLVFHFFYEWGYSLLDLPHLLSADDLLVIEIHYQDRTPFVFPSRSGPSPTELKIQKDPSISFSEYREIFEEGREHLLAGRSYQFNLTFEHTFRFQGTPSCEDFYLKLWERKSSRGELAHLTSIPFLDRLYLSNSPEALFHLQQRKEGFFLFTRPIKGSRRYRGPEDIAKAWEELKASKKDQGELFMITDLLRNDCCKIELPRAEVVAKKRKLVVPGLVHQYSVVKVPLSSHVSLGKIMKALFPGGSITGAPKLSVMEFLPDLEKGKRGFYTGSTVVLDDLMGTAASINIRSATINFAQRKMSLGAGGGITLLSRAREEFDEMMEKVQSFAGLL